MKRAFYLCLVGLSLSLSIGVNGTRADEGIAPGVWGDEQKRLLEYEVLKARISIKGYDKELADLNHFWHSAEREKIEEKRRQAFAKIANARRKLNRFTVRAVHDGEEAARAREVLESKRAIARGSVCRLLNPIGESPYVPGGGSEMADRLAAAVGVYQQIHAGVGPEAAAEIVRSIPCDQGAKEKNIAIVRKNAAIQNQRKKAADALSPATPASINVPCAAAEKANNQGNYAYQMAKDFPKAAESWLAIAKEQWARAKVEASTCEAPGAPQMATRDASAQGASKSVGL